MGEIVDCAHWGGERHPFARARVVNPTAGEIGAGIYSEVYISVDVGFEKVVSAALNIAEDADCV